MAGKQGERKSDISARFLMFNVSGAIGTFLFSLLYSNLHHRWLLSVGDEYR